MILSVAAPTAITTGLFINRRGLLGAVGQVTGYISGGFGAALAGRVAEIAAAHFTQKSAEEIARVAAPFRSGPTGLLWKTAAVLTAASLLVSLAPIKPSKRRKIAGFLGALGSLALRFAVHYISNASARDARATFQQQRARLDDGSSD